MFTYTNRFKSDKLAPTGIYASAISFGLRFKCNHTTKSEYQRSLGGLFVKEVHIVTISSESQLLQEFGAYMRYFFRLESIR
jgi:hypothetical protein